MSKNLHLQVLPVDRMCVMIIQLSGTMTSPRPQYILTQAALCLGKYPEFQLGGLEMSLSKACQIILL